MTLADDRGEVLVVGVDRLGGDDLAAELLERLGEGSDQALAVGLLVVDGRDLLDAGRVEQVLRRERTLDVVGGAGAEVGRGTARFGLARSAPWVRVGSVLAGETWTMFAAASTGCDRLRHQEFSVPTTPTTSSSPASLVAAFSPTSGVAWSSWASSSSVQPGMVLFSLACLMARSTEFLMPRPSADRSPDSGAITPILATLSLLRWCRRRGLGRGCHRPTSPACSEQGGPRHDELMLTHSSSCCSARWLSSDAPWARFWRAWRTYDCRVEQVSCRVVSLLHECWPTTVPDATSSCLRNRAR